jgi:hypothetical protein
MDQVETKNSLDSVRAVVECLRKVAEGKYPDECVGVPVWRISNLADRLEIIERRRKHGFPEVG